MSYCSDMDWNSKWDCENFAAFCSKPIGSPKKLQLADWMIVDDGEIDDESFNLSCGGWNRAASGSDGYGSSAKSSASASTDSSTKDSFRFMKFECSNGNLWQKMKVKGAEVCGSSPPMGASVGSVETLIGLKLGKRTFFEDSGGGGNSRITSLSSMPTPSRNTSTLKKTRSSGQNAPIPRCQVEDCNLDLSMAKEYHQKHRVCEIHSKCPKVCVGGHERRFCQQCSRFHGLSEFDEKKRSCRRRLSDHNARRRKPQQETARFDSTRLSLPFYGTERRQQVSFLLNNALFIQPRIPVNSMGDSSEFNITKGYASKPLGDGVTDEPHGNATNGFMASTNSTSGSKITSHTDAAPEYHHALSLLSSNLWGSGEPETMPLSSSEFWMTELHNPRVLTNNYFQEIPLFKSPYEADFYWNVLN